MSDGAFFVELPNGGRIELQDQDEVDMWNKTLESYVEDYGLIRVNDLVHVGTLLMHNVSLYRAQRDLSDTEKADKARGTMIKVGTEIREVEKTLGIDKKSREAGSQHDAGDYIARLKRAGHEKGVRILERVKRYEGLVADATWRVNLLLNGDDEDRGYHDLTPDKFVEWLDREIKALEEEEKAWARTKGAVFAGKL